MKKLKIVLIAAALAVAAPAFAAGWSSTDGYISTNAGFAGRGFATSQGQYGGFAGSQTPAGYTNTAIGGGVSTVSFGRGMGDGSAMSGSSAYAQQDQSGSMATTNSASGTFAVSMGHGVVSFTNAGAGAAASAGSGSQ